MKVAYLGPFLNSRLRPFINTLSAQDCEKSPGMGGYGLIELVEGRLQRGNHTIVITLDTNLHDPTIIRHGKLCSLYSLPKRGNKSLRDLFAREREMIHEAITDSKPDLIHAHWTREYALSVLKMDIPTIITAHDNPKDILKYMGWNYYPFYFISNYVIKKAKYLTAVSPNVLEYIKKKGKNNCELIPNPLTRNIIADSIKKNRNYDYEYPIITSVLDWNELKNPKNAIRGFNLILQKYPNAQLHLIGNGMGPKEICELWCAENEKIENIFFHGKISNEMLKQHLETTTILLHTSRTEACSLIITEAMVMGIPCIGGNNSGGVPWQLDHGNAGVLRDINEPNQIAEALLTLLNDKEYRAKTGNAARRNALKLFDPDEIYQTWESLYAKTITDYNLNKHYKHTIVEDE